MLMHVKFSYKQIEGWVYLAQSRLKFMDLNFEKNKYEIVR